MKKVTGYHICKCKAITLTFEDGASNSCKPQHLKVIGLDLKTIPKLGDCYACNHCCNFYGLDLCKCGSGKKCCGEPSEKYGELVKFVGWVH